MHHANTADWQISSARLAAPSWQMKRRALPAEMRERSSPGDIRKLRESMFRN